VSRQGTRALAALLAALLSVAALAACGGSDSSPGSSSTGDGAETSPQSSSRESGRSGGESASKPGNEDGGSGSGASVPTSPLQVSGGGSGQFRVKGGDNSIQEFGDEASESDLEEAAKALHDFYVARAKSEWQRACSKLAEVVIEQLRVLASHAKESGQDCPATLAAITPSLTAQVARETTAVDAGSLRVEDSRGFLIYRDGEGAVYAINMADEEGWKVGALAGVPLS
jgi:hypothetical protein